MKYPLRLHGEIQGIAKQQLQDMLPEEIYPFVHGQNGLQIDYEGPYLDLEPILDRIAAASGAETKGHLHWLDHASWEILRYELQKEKWLCFRIDPDHALEKYHLE